MKEQKPALIIKIPVLISQILVQQNQSTVTEHGEDVDEEKILFDSDDKNENLGGYDPHHSQSRVLVELPRFLAGNDTTLHL